MGLMKVTLLLYVFFVGRRDAGTVRLLESGMTVFVSYVLSLFVGLIVFAGFV